MKRAVPFLFLFVLLALPVTALGDVSGDCTITMNGVDANTLATPDAALEVPEDGIIAIEASTSAGEFTGHTVYLEYGGIKWNVDEQVDDGDSWSGTVEVADYSKYGVGLYKVSGESAGVACSGWAFVSVTGNPLGTVAGAAAAGMTVVGGVMIAASAVSAARRPRKRAEARLGQLQFSQGGPWSEDPGRNADWEAEGMVGRALSCMLYVPYAALQTVAFMVSGAGAAGAPAAPARGRKGGGILISVTGVVGAVLAGLGTLVLAQQYSMVYPTGIVLWSWLALWVVGDIVLTTARRRAGVKKAYAMMDAAVAQAQQAPQAQQVLPPPETEA